MCIKIYTWVNRKCTCKELHTFVIVLCKNTWMCKKLHTFVFTFLYSKCVKKCPPLWSKVKKCVILADHVRSDCFGVSIVIYFCVQSDYMRSQDCVADHTSMYRRLLNSIFAVCSAPSPQSLLHSIAPFPSFCTPTLHIPCHPLWLPSTSIAFFVLILFSDLAPYVAILKMFHVKIKFIENSEHCCIFGTAL